MEISARLFTFTIPNGQALSDAIEVFGSGITLTEIGMPAAWTAAELTFQKSRDGVTFDELIDSATETAIQLTVAAGQTIKLNPSWVIYKYLKIRSGTSAVPVNQGADRSIVVTGIPMK